MGTQGDVQPFVVLGRLLQKNGHRVRLATHELFRPMVVKAGLEFFPLGGDPKKLSAFMVKTSGRIFPKVRPSPNYLDFREEEKKTGLTLPRLVPV